MEERRVLRPRSRLLRIMIYLLALILVPPFLVLAVAPMLLMLTPVALIGIPFIVPAMLSSSLAQRTEDKQRASWRPKPPLRQPLRAVH